MSCLLKAKKNPSCLNEPMTKRKKPSLFVFKTLGERQKWACRTCRDSLQLTCQVDHIVPLAEGGSNHFDNLQILCVACHARKTTGETYRRGLRYSPYFGPPAPNAPQPAQPNLRFRRDGLAPFLCKLQKLNNEQRVDPGHDFKPLPSMGRTTSSFNQ